MSTEVILTIVAILTLFLGLVGNIIATVWWASKITTVLEMTRSDVSSLLVDAKAMPDKYVRKTEFSPGEYLRKEDYRADMTRVEAKLDRAWEEIDEINKEP